MYRNNAYKKHILNVHRLLRELKIKAEVRRGVFERVKALHRVASVEYANAKTKMDVYVGNDINQKMILENIVIERIKEMQELGTHLKFCKDIFLATTRRRKE